MGNNLVSQSSKHQVTPRGMGLLHVVVHGQAEGLSWPDTLPELALQTIHLGAGLGGSSKALQDVMYNMIKYN